MKRILSLLGASGLTMLAVDSTQADIFASNPSGGWGSVSITRTLGTPFAVGNAGVTVTSLGFFDKDGDGLSVAHDVGLFATNQTLLGKVTIPGGTVAPLHDGARWVTLNSPLILAPNTEYMLAATVIADEDMLNAASPVDVTIDSRFHLTQAGYAEGFGGAALVYPEDPTSRIFYGFGANFEIVPEPGTGAVLALGLATLLWQRLRRARRSSPPDFSRPRPPAGLALSRPSSGPPLALALALSAVSHAAADVPYGYMHPDTAQLRQWQAELAGVPVYQAPPGYPSLQGSVNLLNHLPFTTADRDQGHSGTCWIWGCQAVMTIDYAIQHPGAPLLTNGFSVQFLNSYVQLVDFMMGGGGTASEFANFYTGMKFAIPWSNENAHWTDRNNWNMTMAATIHTQPNMPLENVAVSSVLTFTNTEAVAIANLKSALDAGHPLWFNMTLANDADWAVFCTFWGKTNANEDTVIDLAYGAGHRFNEYDGGGSHIVACVGYDDRDPDPAKHCWLMLNSWGDGGSNDDGTRRPHGLFRMAMHTKYDATLETNDPDHPAQMFEWGLLETTWTTKVRKSVGGFNVNVPLKNPAAASLCITNVSFPRSSLMTNVAAALVQVNWQDFPCAADKGAWTRVPGGFHYEPTPGGQPAVWMDINTNTCTWSATATNFPAEYARLIDPYRGLRIQAICTVTNGSPDNLELGTVLFAFDELDNTTASGFASPPPDAPSLSLSLNGSQGLLRIAGETGRTCEVLEAQTLGGGWLSRALVPMTQPVEEITLPAPLDTNRFWQVKVQ